MSMLNSILKALLRRKQIDQSSGTTLNRCLTTLDLTALGIGSTLGLGIYVLAGEVASRTAGPAVVLSFLIAAVASVFAGLCYAEFGARVPKAGSAYVYSYVTVGEFMAFVIGWNLVLEYVIGTASVARGYSGYIDSLFNGTIQSHLKDWMPMHASGFSAYPDFLAFGLTLLLTVMLAVGVKESTRFNSIFTGINLCIVLFVVIAGAFHVHFDNWKLQKTENINGTVIEKIPHGHGDGGFFPYGFSGMMAGAATCFYGFVGFDCIATTAEEAKNPQRSIPISIILSLLIIFLAYFGVSAIQTLMLPYYMQTEEVTKGAPLPYIFEYVGWTWAKWIVSIGALAGLSTSLLGAMFPLPRILYAMGNDGLIFRFLAVVNERFKTPLMGTIISGVFSGGMAAVFDLIQLADMMSIGTLLAYTLVAVSVLLLRYKDYDLKADENQKYSNSDQYDVRDVFRQCFNLDKNKIPTPLSSKIASSLVIFISVILIVFDAILVHLEDKIFNGHAGSIISASLLLITVIIGTICLSLQPSPPKNISFQVPLVPLTPILSIFVNFYLMLKLSLPTWIRFAVWMFIGLIIYIFYGFRNSNERTQK